VLELSLLRVDCMWTSDAGVNPCLCSQWNCASLMLRTSCSAQVTSYASMLGRTQLPSLPRQARLVVCNVSAANATLVVFQIKSKGGVRAGPSVPRSFLAFWWAFRSTSCATSSYTPVFGDLLLLPTFPLRDWLRTNPDRVDFSATSQS